MKTEGKCIIKNARVKILENCISSSVLGEVEFEEKGQDGFLYLCEIDGIPEFRLSSESIWGLFDKGEEATDVLEETLITQFDSVDLPCDYERLIPTLKAGRSSDGLLLFLIALVRCPSEAVKGVLQIGIGQSSDRVIVPSDYLDLEDM